MIIYSDPDWDLLRYMKQAVSVSCKNWMEEELWLQTEENGRLLAHQDSMQECFCWYWNSSVKHQGPNSVFMVLCIMDNPLKQVLLKWVWNKNNFLIQSAYLLKQKNVHVFQDCVSVSGEHPVLVIPKKIFYFFLSALWRDISWEHLMTDLLQARWLTLLAIFNTWHGNYRCCACLSVSDSCLKIPKIFTSTKIQQRPWVPHVNLNIRGYFLCVLHLLAFNWIRSSKWKRKQEYTWINFHLYVRHNIFFSHVFFWWNAQLLMFCKLQMFWGRSNLLGLCSAIDRGTLAHN